MPTAYAHWRFGADCIKKMPAEIQDIINEHRDIYDIGVHGPDIFFYDLKNKPVPEYGGNMHEDSARYFFEKAKTVLVKCQEKEEIIAYMLGFLSHFTLDSTCHGYVDRKKEFTGISHNMVEAQWDRHVILLDNKVPNKVDRAESLKPSKEIAKVISYFHAFDEEIVYRSIKAQKTIVTALNCRFQIKEKILKKLLHTLGLHEFADLFIGFQEYDECKDSNLRLDKLRAKALDLYPKLLKNLLAYLNNKEKLNKYYDHNFEAWDDYKDIPILTYEQELKYKV